MSSEWERRKEFLIRSLFQDISVPSTIPEYDDEESRFSDATWSPPVYKERPAISVPFERHSPLPDLTVEREPNRHDEPEEFYQNLEKKILRVYKKLFLYDELSGSFESDVSLIQFYGNSKQECVREYNDTTREETEIIKMTSNIEHSNEVIEPTGPIESSTSSTSQSSGVHHEIVEVTADVHKENDTTESNNVPDLESSRANIQTNSDTRIRASCGYPEVNNNDENLEQQLETSLNVGSTSDDREIEVMLSHRCTPSVSSLQQRSSSRSSYEPRVEEVNKSFMMESQQSPEPNIDTSKDYPAPDHSSTPIKRKLQNDFTRAPSPSKLPKVKHVSVQTSDTECSAKGVHVDWEKIKRNFFFGIPKIYKLVKVDY